MVGACEAETEGPGQRRGLEGEREKRPVVTCKKSLSITFDEENRTKGHTKGIGRHDDKVHQIPTSSILYQ